MKKFDLVRLAPMHRRQLLMLSEGAKVIDVATATGRSERQVVYLKNSAAGSQYLETIVRRKEQHAIENSLIGLCIERLRDILQDPAVNTQTLLRAIENVLDREPTGTFSRRREEKPAECRVFDSVAIAELGRDAARLGLGPPCRPALDVVSSASL